VKAFILAAGRGERLLPLSLLRPKPLFPVVNRPVIHYVIEYLKRHGIMEFIVNLHHLSHQVRQDLGDGGGLGVVIHYSPEFPHILGTAGGLKQAEDLLRDETFLVVNGDLLVNFDLSQALAYHRERHALATLVLREDPGAPEGKDITLDGRGRLVRFLTHGQSRTPAAREAMFTGVTIMDPAFLAEIPPGRPSGISEEVYPRLLGAGAPLFGWVMEGPWRDVGTPSRYLAANWEALEGVFGPVAAGEDPPGGASVIPPVHIGEGAQLEDGARIGPHTVLGPGCRLGRGAWVAESVLWEGVCLEAGARAWHAIIASGVHAKATFIEEVVIPKGRGLETAPLRREGA
jgi:NDP-sugar pyrophosphorylase family protein